MSYHPPLAEQRFALEVTADLFRRDGAEALTPELLEAILEESAKLTAGVFAPLNRTGDVVGASWTPEGVVSPPGFKDAYRQYAEGGWNALACATDHGGQGLPFAVACAVHEQLISANMAFALCMMLTQGAIEALSVHGSDELKRLYLPRLVSGEWTGTMNLTEPQAGSDVGALRTRAERHADGSYRIAGSKIFITWGDHDLTDNIVHLVLARLPDAPAGTKGLSLFLVPKFLLDENGNPGARNDVTCVSIEHKLGIHASPTCTMSFGDRGACVGHLVGEEHRGIAAMFTMMNHARITVGLQGVAIGEAAYQHALSFARERIQSAKLGGPRQPVPIIEHGDVRRMLLTMRSTTEAARALLLLNAAAVDRGHQAGDANARHAAQGLADLLTPVTKAYATDMGVEVASLGIQVFGGMGFVEETGAAQYYRDIRIAPIYEGTNGIQALDLVTRKLRQDGGEHWRALITDLRARIDVLPSVAGWHDMRSNLVRGLCALEQAAEWLSDPSRAPDEIAAGATPFLRMSGIVIGGALIASQAVAADARLRDESGADRASLMAKITSARFFAGQIVPTALGLEGQILRGAELLADFGREFAG